MANVLKYAVSFEFSLFFCQPDEGTQAVLSKGHLNHHYPKRGEHKTYITYPALAGKKMRCIYFSVPGQQREQPHQRKERIEKAEVPAAEVPLHCFTGQYTVQAQVNNPPQNQNNIT